MSVVNNVLLFLSLLTFCGCKNKSSDSVRNVDVNTETKKAESDVADGKIQPCGETIQEIGDRVLREANEKIQQSEQYKAALKILKELKSGKRQWMVQIKWIEYAEISPGEFLAFEQCDTVLDPELERSLLPDMIPDDLDGSSEIIIPWKENKVHWKGVDVPISLRVYEDTLYMIGFDREDMKNIKFRFYKQEGDTFNEISTDEYPKSIATKNLWFHKWQIEEGDVDAEINMDPNNFQFLHSLTANIWCSLITGKSYSEVYRLTGEEERKIVKEYLAEYKPIPLTKIIYTPDDSKNSNEPNQVN